MTLNEDGQRTAINPLTLARLLKLRENYQRNLQLTIEGLDKSAWEHQYIDLELEAVAEGINYLQGCKDEAARRKGLVA